MLKVKLAIESISHIQIVEFGASMGLNVFKCITNLTIIIMITILYGNSKIPESVKYLNQLSESRGKYAQIVYKQKIVQNVDKFSITSLVDQWFLWWHQKESSNQFSSNCNFFGMLKKIALRCGFFFWHSNNMRWWNVHNNSRGIK